MPHVHIFLYPGRTNEQKKSLADHIINDMVEVIGTSEDVISIGFEEVTPENWDEYVVKPFIAEKKEFLVKPPKYESKYFKDG